MHAVALVVVLNVPVAQLAHERSWVELPSRLTNCPAVQLRQGVQAVTLFAVLNEPVGQALQTRLVNAEPSMLAN